MTFSHSHEPDLTLAVECSLKSLALALLQDGRIIASCLQELPEPHSLTLLMRIDALLRQANVDLLQIGKILFCNGPGGYTSLRVGLATLMGLFINREVRFLPVSSLLFRCVSACQSGDDTVICLVRANQDWVYFGRYEAASHAFDQALLSKDQIKVRLFEQTGRVRIIGEGLNLFSAQELPDGMMLEPVDVCAPEAFAVILKKAFQNERPFDQACLHYMQDAVLS